MPQVAHNNHRKIQQHRISKIGLVILLIFMSIGLAIWLYWSMRKKEMYKRSNPPNVVDSVGTGKMAS